MIGGRRAGRADEDAVPTQRARGDEAMASLYDAQLADEITHVRFANEHVAREVARDPRTVLRIGRAMDYALRAFRQVMGREAIEAVAYRVNEAGRREAGFREEEVREISEIRKHRQGRP